MLNEPSPGLASNEDLARLVEDLGDTSTNGLARVEGLLARFPEDSRLHFLKGSLLAAERQYDAGRFAMRRAVELAPDFHLARYQLGFLELTSGDAEAAQVTWAPLQELEEENALRRLSDGLSRLARDEFDPAIQMLERGMRENSEFPAINHDIGLILDALRERKTAVADDEPLSAAQLMLHQFRARGPSH